MGLCKELLLFGILLTLAECARQKMVCRSDSSVTTAPGRIVGPTLSSATRRPLIARDEKVKFEVDACCGSKPFTSALSLCCLGRTVRRASRRCCISGPPVLRLQKCSCYPHSSWINDQLEAMSDLRSKAISLMEDAQIATERLTKVINQKEELVRELDAEASSLYQSFLDEIGLERSEDPDEVQYIYDLVTFLHSNEEERLEKTAWEEEEFLGRPMFDVGRKTLTAAEKAKGDLLNLLRTLLGSLKLKQIDMHDLIERMKAEGRNSPLESDLWKFTRKKQEVTRGVSSALDRSAPEEGERTIETLVIQRNQVLEQIRVENEFIIEGGLQLEELARLFQFASSEQKVISQVLEILEETLEESLVIEDEIEALEIEVEESEGGSFDSLPSNTRTTFNRQNKERRQSASGCDVSDWLNHTQLLSEEVQENFPKLERILRSIPDSVIENRRGNDPLPELFSIFSSREEFT